MPQVPFLSSMPKASDTTSLSHVVPQAMSIKHRFRKFKRALEETTSKRLRTFLQHHHELTSKSDQGILREPNYCLFVCITRPHLSESRGFVGRCSWIAKTSPSASSLHSLPRPKRVKLQRKASLECTAEETYEILA